MRVLRCQFVAWAISLLGCTFSWAADGELPSYEVARTATTIGIDGSPQESAWFAAASLDDFCFPWYKAGQREQSIVKLVWDDECLYIASVCQDAHITARHTAPRGPIAGDDCIEIMLAPRRDRPAFYFNVEWNVVGGYVDGHRPNGANSPRVEWDARDLRLAGKYVGSLNDDRDEDEYWCTEVAIPWANFREHLVNFPPKAGDEFRANFNRHGGLTNEQYSQWSSVGTPAPAFHVPQRFGRLILSAKATPF